MQQTKTRKIYGLFLLSAALLEFALVVTSMVTSFFFLGAYSDMQPQWSTCLVALVLLGVAAVGAYQIRTPQATTPVSQHAAILPGLGLGIVSASLLSIPGLALALVWAAFGLPMLIVVLVASPATIASISPVFALTSVALYSVFATCYSVCAYRATRHTGSIKQGMGSSILGATATFLSATLMFSLIHVIAYFVFRSGSDVVVPSTFPGVSPLVNYLAGYQSIVYLIAYWLVIPIVLGLLIALTSSFIARRTTTTVQPASTLVD